MDIQQSLEQWDLALVPHEARFSATRWSEVENAGFTVIPARVPGNFELDLMREYIIPTDVYYGTNIQKLRDWEFTHLWYHTTFTYTPSPDDTFLSFGGIDTAAEIYIDGVLTAFSEDMFIPVELPLDGLTPGEHEVLVHIIPALVYTQDKTLPLYSQALQQNRDSLLIRKAPYMFGWDIMPRGVSGGLWKPVQVVTKPRVRLEDVFVQTNLIEETRAQMRIDFRLILGEGTLQEMRMKVESHCRDSHREQWFNIYNLHQALEYDIIEPYLWWPKNYGEPDLYDITMTLYRGEEELTAVTVRAGVRKIELERTSLCGENGKFRFLVNGKPVFLMGTNWVPTDVFPSRHTDYDKRGLDMVEDLGCNIIRCWGGNAYPDDALYDFCDEHGILVWQDFAMACGSYPQNGSLRELFSREAAGQIIRLRNHPCIGLWSGDNECDFSWLENGSWHIAGKTDRHSPAQNALTRRALPDVLRDLDGSRPYLPSSPYMDEESVAFYGKIGPAEDHLWGPRDYFKGNYYRTAQTHFVSEIGYHGCPSPASMRRMMSAEALAKLGTPEAATDREWLAHATCPDPVPENHFAYRIPLMMGQVDTLFGCISADWEDFSLQSQISQAEANKFFVEHFRAEKDRRSGIIWWNVVDGWPQISDAVVDWYGVKKLSYAYLKADQQAFCLLCNEPDEKGSIPLIATNDSRRTVSVSFRVTEALSGETVLEGKTAVEPDGAVQVGTLAEKPHAYYLITWDGDVQGKNHYVPAIGQKLDLDEYKTFLKVSGYAADLEGFAPLK